MKIHRIDIPKNVLIEMDSDERAFLLLIGHIQNEINSLNKVFTWCLNSSKSEKSSVEGLADGLQAMIYARLLAGKLCETWEVLRKYYFATRLSQRIDSKLPLESQEALIRLKLNRPHFPRHLSVFFGNAVHTLPEIAGY